MVVITKRRNFIIINVNIVSQCLQELSKNKTTGIDQVRITAACSKYQIDNLSLHNYIHGIGYTDLVMYKYKDND